MLLVGRYKRAATRASGLGNTAAARRWLTNARAVLADAPPTPELFAVAESLVRAEALLEAGQHEKFRKRTKYESYSTSHSRPIR